MTDTTTSPTLAAFDGGCLCGHIRYRATAAPVRGVIWHRVWVQQRIAWFEVCDELPRFPQNSSAVASKATADPK